MYVKIYIIAVQGFIETVIIEVCPTTIRNKLQDYLAKEIETCYQEAEKMTRFFAERERTASIYRINPKSHVGLRARVKRAFNGDGNSLTENAEIRLDKAQFKAISTQKQKKTGQTPTKIHGVLNNHYKVTSIRFVENVTRLVARQLLNISGKAPFTAFNSSFVAALTEEQVDQIACKDPEVTVQRKKVNREIANLKEALTLLHW